MKKASRSFTGPARELAEERVRRVEILISHLLRAGVIVSLVLITAGTALSFVRHPDYVSSHAALERLTRPGAAVPQSLREVAADLAAWRGQGLVTLGLLLLIATPVLRVGVSIFAFVYQRDAAYVAITLLVFCLLLLSFALGRVE